MNSLLRAQFADLTDKYVHQFALLFLDLQKKCDSAEISTKALDLRGMLDALRLMPPGRGCAAWRWTWASPTRPLIPTSRG